jgi:hypothetical protein
MKYLMLIVSSLLLSACAATPYATPTEGDIANLKIPMPGTKFNPRWIFQGWPSGGWTSMHISIGESDEGGCIDGRLSSVDSDVIAEDGTIVVPANKDLFIQIGASFGDVGCIIGTITQFEKDKNYELKFQLSSDRCAIAIPQKTIAGELVPTRLYEYETSGWSTACKVEGDIDKKLVFCLSGLAPFGDRGCFE